MKLKSYFSFLSSEIITPLDDPLYRLLILFVHFSTKEISNLKIQLKQNLSVSLLGNISVSSLTFNTKVESVFI